MSAPRLGFELVLALTLLAFGLVGLPVAVYWVGQFVIGGYESDAGMAGLIGAVWDGLGSGSLPAWFLVVSPYLVIQLLRLAVAVLRRRESPSGA